jgi:hypothetical protein
MLLASCNPSWGLLLRVLAVLLVAALLIGVSTSGELYSDGRDLKYYYVLAAFPAARNCFIVWTRFGLSFQLDYRHAVKLCEDLLRSDSALSRFVANLKDVEFKMHDEGDAIPTLAGPRVLFGRVDQGRSPAATLSYGVKQKVLLLRSRFSSGVFCVDTYSLSYSIMAHPGATLIHELGHVEFNRLWFKNRTSEDLGRIKQLSDFLAVEAENAWWERQGPRAPHRLRHDQKRGCLVTPSLLSKTVD